MGMVGCHYSRAGYSGRFPFCIWADLGGSGRIWADLGGSGRIWADIGENGTIRWKPSVPEGGMRDELESGRMGAESQ